MLLQPHSLLTALLLTIEHIRLLLSPLLQSTALLTGMGQVAAGPVICTLVCCMYLEPPRFCAVQHGTAQHSALQRSTARPTTCMAARCAVRVLPGACCAWQGGPHHLPGCRRQGGVQIAHH